MRQRITIRIADALDRFVSELTFDFKSKQDAYRFIMRDWLGARRYRVSLSRRPRDPDCAASAREQEP